MLLAGTSLALVRDDIPILLLPLASGKQALTGIIRLHGGKDAPGCLGSSHTIILCRAGCSWTPVNILVWCLLAPRSSWSCSPSHLGPRITMWTDWQMPLGWAGCITGERQKQGHLFKLWVRFEVSGSQHWVRAR